MRHAFTRGRGRTRLADGPAVSSDGVNQIDQFDQFRLEAYSRLAS